MRQFLLGKNVAYGALVSSKTLAADGLNAFQDGAVGFVYNNNGVPTLDSTGAALTKECMLVLGRPDGKNGPVVLPVFKNNFTYVKGEYESATTFAASITIPAPTAKGDYTIIIAKKGVKFNERNKWTGSVHVVDTTMTAQTLATQLAKQLNGNANHGCTVTVAGAVLTITAKEAAVDYAIVPADLLYGTTVTITAKGIPAYGDAKYVQDLAEKAAADAGFEYTYRDAYYYLYPDYPLNPLKGSDSTDVGYTIFTLRFAEPRDVKTRDEVVNQIIQVAFPTGASAITTFETVCKELAGVNAEDDNTTVD